MLAIYLAIIYTILATQVKYRGVEQLVARRAHNPEVAGSSPVPATSRSVLIGRSFFLAGTHLLFKSYIIKTYVKTTVYDLNATKCSDHIPSFFMRTNTVFNWLI